MFTVMQNSQTMSERKQNREKITIYKHLLVSNSSYVIIG